MDLTGIYRIFHTNTKECIIYSAANWSFSKITHNQEYKENFTKFREIKITLCILPDHVIKVNIGHKQISSKYTNSWILNNSLLNNKRSKKESKEKEKNETELELKCNTTKLLWHIRNGPMRKFYSSNFIY